MPTPTERLVLALAQRAGILPSLAESAAMTADYGVEAGMDPGDVDDTVTAVVAEIGFTLAELEELEHRRPTCEV